VGAHRKIKLWDTATGELLSTINEGGWAAFSPDGTRFVSRDSRQLKVWDAKTARLLRTLQGFIADRVLAAFSPDGAQFALHDNRAVRFFDAASGRLSRQHAGDTNVSSVAFVPDGARALSIGGGAVLEDQDCIRSNRCKFISTVTLLDPMMGQSLQRFVEHDTNSPLVAALSGDGKWVLSGGVPDAGAKLWDAATAEPVRTFEHGGRVTAVAFSREGSHILFGASDGTLALAETATGTLLRSFPAPSKKVTFAALSPDGTHALSGTEDGNLVLWDISTGKRLRVFERLSGVVRSAAFSPDGARVAAAASDRTARLWDVASGRLERAIAHSRQVLSVAFSADGKHLLTGGEDGAARLWRVDTGELAVTWVVAGERWIAVTLEGFYDASADGLDLLTFLSAGKVIPMDRAAKLLHRPDLVQQKIAGDPDGKVKAAVSGMSFD
jgi:WD40 repeat protein